MDQQINLGAGKWLRYKHYAVRNGNIQPAPMAAREVYDPWALFNSERSEESNGNEASASLLYRSLFQLVRDIERSPTGILPLDKRYEAKVLAWVESYGLLGTLLRRTRQVALAPRFAFDKRCQPAIIQVRYAFSYNGWCEDATWLQLGRQGLWGLMGGSSTPVEGFRTNAVAPVTLWSGRLDPPGVLIEMEDSPFLIFEPLGMTWARFFPTVPEAEWETYHYPCPATPDFWKIYAEPVSSFLEDASKLYKALWHLPSTDNERDNVFIRPGDPEDEPEAILELQRLTSMAAPTVRTLPDRSRHRWLTSSLISSLALMAIQDFVEGSAFTIECEECGRRQIAKSRKRRFCSDTCKSKNHKRKDAEAKKSLD